MSGIDFGYIKIFQKFNLTVLSRSIETSEANIYIYMSKETGVVIL